MESFDNFFFPDHVLGVDVVDGSLLYMHHSKYRHRNYDFHIGYRLFVNLGLLNALTNLIAVQVDRSVPLFTTGLKFLTCGKNGQIT